MNILSLGAEVHGTGVGFVEQYVHDPGGQEGEPADHDHVSKTIFLRKLDDP